MTGTRLNLSAGDLSMFTQSVGATSPHPTLSFKGSPCARERALGLAG